MKNRPESVIIDKTANGYDIAIQDDLTGSAVGFSMSEEAHEQLRLHFVRLSLPKNTEIAERSYHHDKDPNINSLPISEFSFRKGAMWLKKVVLGNKA